MRENRGDGEEIAPVFAETGPQGHRGRMRLKLLIRGPGALADYELLEMLLFLGIERRDTKPLAKVTINRFGSLAGALASSPAQLAYLGGGCVVALKLAQEASVRLARAETRDRAHLPNWDGVQRYLDSGAGPSVAPRTLYLNNRNRLLADEIMPGDAGSEAQIRAVAARALELHATAIILVGDPGSTTALRIVARQLQQASDVLTLKLHDCVLGGPGQWRSLRSSGQLN